MPLVLSLDAYAAVACQVLVNEELNYILKIYYLLWNGGKFSPKVRWRRGYHLREKGHTKAGFSGVEWTWT